MENAAERFSDLCRTHGARFRRTARRVLHSPEDAEDTVQEALFRAWKERGQFREGASLATWVYKIVLNAAIERYKQNAVSPSWGAVPLDDTPLGKQDGTLEKLEAADRLRLALELVNWLPRRQRECLGAILRGEPLDRRLRRSNKMARHWGIQKLRQILASHAIA